MQLLPLSIGSTPLLPTQKKTIQIEVIGNVKIIGQSKCIWLSKLL